MHLGASSNSNSQWQQSNDGAQGGHQFWAQADRNGIDNCIGYERSLFAFFNKLEILALNGSSELGIDKKLTEYFFDNIRVSS